MFQEAERLAPPPGLWRKIETQAASGPRAARTRADNGIASGWMAGPWRMAASVVLAAGLLGLGLFLKHRSAAAEGAAEPAAAGTGMAPQTAADNGSEEGWVDPELLSWHADLGEVDEESDEAGEAGEVL